MSGVVKTVKGAFFGGAEKEAGQLEAEAAEAGVAEQRRQFDITQQQLAPFREAGVSALQTQQALLGQLGPEQAATAFAQFQESPGQAFLRQRQERALLRGASAIGGLGGGNIRTALQEQAANIASTQFGEFQTRLAGISGAGQQTALGLGELGAKTAANIQEGLLVGGEARASGVLGQAAGQRAGIKRIAGAFI